MARLKLEDAVSYILCILYLYISKPKSQRCTSSVALGMYVPEGQGDWYLLFLHYTIDTFHGLRRFDRPYIYVVLEARHSYVVEGCFLNTGVQLRFCEVLR